LKFGGRSACIWLILAAVTAGLAGCSAQKPILVGFSGQITGKEGDLGVPARNGIYLAADQVNQSGGIGGRQVEILVEDDHGQAAEAKAADQRLIEKGVVAIIGHVTSSISLAALEVTQPAGIVLLGPTTTSARLTGKDDLFFRVVADNTPDAGILAARIVQERGITRLAILYDEDNPAYTEEYARAVSKTVVSLNGEVTRQMAFSNSQDPDFEALLVALRQSQPQALLIIASALNSALIIQHVRMLDWDIPLFASDWADSDTFLQNGGDAIEGVELVVSYNVNSSTPAMQAFRKQYLDRFGYQPNFAAAQGYEAMLILAEALKNTFGSTKGLPDALRGIQNFPVLSGEVSMDSYGDMYRPLYLLRVEQGAFKTAAEYPRTSPGSGQ
jgi:branched-chain amino acid transport system substrate-binding protein